MSKLHTVLLSLALLSSPAFANSNLLTNGDFESGDFTGWSHVGAVGEQYVDLDYSGVASAHSGYVYYDGTTNGLGTLSQSVATLAGATYTIEFDLLRVNSWGTPDKLDNQTVVNFGGATLMNQTNAVTGDWVHYSLAGVATAASTALQFNLHNNYDYTEIDNVSVVLSAVPEPSMALMMVAGLVLLVRRRAKRPPPF